MITAALVIGDLAADRIRTLHAEADRLNRHPGVPDRTAPTGRWTWRRAWKRTPRPTAGTRTRHEDDGSR